MNFFKKIILYTFIFVSTLLFGIFFYLFEHNWVDVSAIESFSHAQPSIVYDDEGNEFIRFALDRRAPITYDKFPKVLVDAFIATEDQKFFSHSGISIKGMVRAVKYLLRYRRIVGGGSTITQQVARNLFLSNKQTMSRKIREIFLSFQLERHFTKKQILEFYLNNIYFGRGIYGVEAACQRFWKKSATEISIDEAATLAAVAKSAKLYSPLNAPENAKRRRNIILKVMRRDHFITEEQFTNAIEKEIVISDHIPGNAIRLYIRERIRQWAEKKWGKETLYKKGLQIQITINKEKQRLAEKFFRTNIEQHREKIGNQLNGGMISIEPHSGKIKVCIGGYDFHESQFNRAFQAVRQMGSSFKPIVYTAALLEGIEPNTVMIDEPLEMHLPGCLQPWKPTNWNHKFEGKMTLAKALSYSNNIVTIKTLLKTGIPKVIALAKEFGLHRSLQPYPSLALGTVETTVIQSVASFNVFTNNGIYVEPYLVEWVKDTWGKKLWEYEPVTKKILDTKTNSKMVNVLSLRLKKHKEIVGRKNWIEAEVIGKTGSTNGAGTTWFVGATPELTTSIYIGRDDGKPMGKYVFSTQTAYPIWFNLYKNISFSKKQFYIDPELHEVPVNWVSGKKAYNLKSENTVVLLQ